MKKGKIVFVPSFSGGYFNAFIRKFIFWVDLGAAYLTKESAINAIKFYEENHITYID